jgi:hypothetical protein
MVPILQQDECFSVTGFGSRRQQLPVRDRSATVGRSQFKVHCDGRTQIYCAGSSLIGTADSMHLSVHLRARLIAASSDSIGVYHRPIYFIILGFRLRVS